MCDDMFCWLHTFPVFGFSNHIMNSYIKLRKIRHKTVFGYKFGKALGTTRLETYLGEGRMFRRGWEWCYPMWCLYNLVLHSGCDKDRKGSFQCGRNYMLIISGKQSWQTHLPLIGLLETRSNWHKSPQIVSFSSTQSCEPAQFTLIYN